MDATFNDVSTDLPAEEVTNARNFFKHFTCTLKRVAVKEPFRNIFQGK
jgi:hypothetical protein